MLWRKDLSGNKRGNTPVTCYRFSLLCIFLTINAAATTKFVIEIYPPENDKPNSEGYKTATSYRFPNPFPWIPFDLFGGATFFL
jgi:hypothetical protein